MKKSIIVYLLTSLICLGGCSQGNILKPDSPSHTAILLDHYLEIADYTLFNSLFHEYSQDKITEQDFYQLVLKKKSGNDANGLRGTGINLYETLSFHNGTLLLVHFVADEVNGEYQIQNVTVVPNEMHSLFE
ncbi:MAG: hypothetical protein ACRCST_03020 [Turicibacter sp.]